jgi:hypothetical protein
MATRGSTAWTIRLVPLKHLFLAGLTKIDPFPETIRTIRGTNRPGNREFRGISLVGARRPKKEANISRCLSQYCFTYVPRPSSSAGRTWTFVPHAGLLRQFQRSESHLAYSAQSERDFAGEREVQLVRPSERPSPQPSFC